MLTVSMARCLRQMEKHGYAERTWTGERNETWKWTIGGQNSPPQQIDKGILKGLFSPKEEDRDLVVMTSLGRLYAARAVELGLDKPQLVHTAAA